MHSSITRNHARLPVKNLMSFWRSRLNGLLRQDVLLRRIIVNGKRISFETQSWQDYWHGAFPRNPLTLKHLHEAWRAHRINGFSGESGAALGKAYMDSVLEAIKGQWPNDARQRLQSMENVVVCRYLISPCSLEYFIIQASFA